jgi:hypothetical protein
VSIEELKRGAELYARVLVIPTIGRSSASSEYPIALMKALRKNSENPASP